MKIRTTVILLAIAIAASCWIIFYEKDRPNTEESQRRAQNVLNFERDDVEGIVIENGDDKIQLRKAGDKWRLEAPIKDQADTSKITTVLSDLETWQKDQAIPAEEMESDKARLEEYDLVKPKLRLKLLGKDMPAEIWFGKDAALEGKMYVRFANDKETFLTRQTVKTAIAKKPEEFRDRKLTDLGTAEVSRLVLKTAAGEMEVQKQGELWKIVKPLNARADADKIRDLIAQVTTAQIQQFVAEDRGVLQRYGLAEPRGAITLFSQDDQQGQTLQIGGVPEKEQEQVYVRFSARNFVYTLPKKIEQILNTTPADLRDRHLIRIDTDNLDRLTIDAADIGKTVLARKDETWQIASRNNQPANTAEVNRLLDTLENEQVTKFVEDVASDLAKYGLDRPQLQVTFSSFASDNTAETSAGEQPFATLSLGRVDGDVVYARVGEEPFVVAARRTLLDGIYPDPVQWQELAVFKFKPEEVHRLGVVTNAGETTLVRGADNEWTRANGNEPINQVNLQSLLNTLTNLRAVRWVGGPTPPQAFGQQQIAVTFTTSADDKDTHKLFVGGPTGEGMWYGRVEGRDGVFILSNPDFNALRLPLAPKGTPAAPAAAASPVAEPQAPPR
ncbi:hypothetical protein BH18VER1_BH18VER1_19990 [soil metagenome]